MTSQWDDKSSYDYTTNHSNQDWAWEFIRRDENYRKDWNTAWENYKKVGFLSPLAGLFDSHDPSPLTNFNSLEETDSIIKRVGKLCQDMENVPNRAALCDAINAVLGDTLSKKIDRNNPTFKSRLLAKAILAKFSGKTDELDAFIDMLKNEMGDNYPLALHQSKKQKDRKSTFQGTLTNYEDVENFAILSKEAFKWRLRYFQNPESKKLLPNNYYVVREIYRGDTAGVEEIEDTKLVPYEDNTLIVIFDLTKPLSPQIEAAAESAKRYQVAEIEDFNPKGSGEVTANKQALWVKYIRLLDARLNGIKRKDGAVKIFGEKTVSKGISQLAEDRWDEALKQINSIIENNYRHIVY